MTCASGLAGEMSGGKTVGATGTEAFSGGTGWSCATECCGRMAAPKLATTVAVKNIFLMTCVFIFSKVGGRFVCRIQLDSWTIFNRNHSTTIFPRSICWNRRNEIGADCADLQEPLAQHEMICRS
jgi:hypothetical protein